MRVRVVVGDVDQTLTAFRRAHGGDELPITFAQVSKGAIVLAVQVQDGHPHATFSEVPGPVEHVESPVLGRDSVGGILKAASLHCDDTDGLKVVQHRDYASWNSLVEADILSRCSTFSRTGPPSTNRINESRVSLATENAPISSRHRSTSSSDERCSAPPRHTLSTIALTPGLSGSPNCSETKFILSIRVPVSIHSVPWCQPSTLGGLLSCCPIHTLCWYLGIISRLGLSNSMVMRSTLTSNSAGPLTFLYRASSDLKKSELNSTRKTDFRS